MQAQEPLLNESFEIWLGNTQKVLKILQKHLVIGQTKIDLKDTIGLVTDLQKNTGAKVYKLYTYSKMKKIFRSQKRYLQFTKFEVVSPEKQIQLQNSLIPIINNRKPGQSNKILICFNPNAGSNSRKHLSAILDFLNCTNLTYQIFETQYRNHCLQKLKQLKQNKNQDQYTAVAIVSGDGLMHQYVNSFSNIPVTHVPAGSGNAFAKSQTTRANQNCGDRESIYLVIKNNKQKFNIVKYQLQKIDQPIYSFLSLSWGIMSDLDINSQFLRCLGGLRFQVYGLWRLISLKRYRAKVTYSTIVSNIPPFLQNLDNNPDFHTMDNTFLHTIFCLIPYISDKYKIAPLIDLKQRFIDMQAVLNQNGRSQLAKYLLSSDSGSHFNEQNHQPAQGYNFKYDQIKSFRIQPLDPNQMGVISIDGQAYQSQKVQGSFYEQQFEAFA